MKFFPTPIHKFICTGLIMMFSVMAFGQNDKILLDKILKNPEYQADWRTMIQMREQGKDDKFIVNWLNDKELAKLKHARQMNTEQVKKYGKPITPKTSCDPTDIGFEAGTFGTWTGEEGCENAGNPTSCPLVPFGPVTLPYGTRITIPATGTDPCADVPGFPIQIPSPNGGNFSAKLGNYQTPFYDPHPLSGKERMSHSFIVQPGDTSFVYQYAVVLEDPGHVPANQPYFDFVIIETLTGDTIPCSFQHYVAGAGIPGFQQSLLSNPTGCVTHSGATVYYKPWTSVGVNLGGYVGSQVTIICTTSDCTQCGHFSYTYLDFSCGTTQGSQYCISGTGVVLVAPNEPGATYSWSTGQTTDSITVNPQIIDTVTLTVVLPSGCNYTINYILQPTVINAGFTHTLTCNTATFTDTTNITGGTLTNWQWTFPGGTPNAYNGQFPPTITYPPGSYVATLLVTSQAGCTDTLVTVPFTILPPPVPNAGPDITLCSSAGVQLCGSAGYVSYSWLPGGGTTSCITVNPGVTTTYTLIVTDANGCTGSDQVVINIGSNPTVFASPADTICIGQSTQLSASTGAVNPTYTWVPGTGLSNTTIANPTANPGFTNTYTVYITDAFGCTAFATTTITVGNYPFVSAISSDTICPFEFAQLSANTSNGMPPYTYFWVPTPTVTNPNISNPMANPQTSTIYTVTVTDSYGCQDDTTTSVIVGTEPSAAIAPWTPELTCDGYVIPLGTNGSSNATSYFWDFGDGTYSTLQNPVHTYPFNGTYIITLVVYNPPCKDSTDTTVIVSDLSGFINILPANVFTPNNDNMNDCFRPAFQSTNALATPTIIDTLMDCVTITVFDRWGIKMFETTDTEKCWDGRTLGGKPANEGTYYYIAKFGEMSLRGYVTLLRKKNK